MTWFVRMQRTWREYVHRDSPEYFHTTVRDSFDGFERAKGELMRAQERGDELGWHYHAYSYVHRDDLDHDHKVRILANDLVSCGEAIQQRHPEFRIRSFRWGWFFLADYSLCEVLRRMGIDVDASLNPSKDGKRVATFATTYPPSITSVPQRLNGTYYFPIRQTSLIHDWNVVEHEFSWRSLTAAEATENRAQFKGTLLRLAEQLGEARGSFVTYDSVLSRT